MANQAQIRILAVDDHALLRKGIRMLISTGSDMQLVAEASTGREAVQEFRTHRPDITLMDLQMPDMSGVEAIIAIRGEFPNARVIVLTTYAGDAQVLHALNATATNQGAGKCQETGKRTGVGELCAYQSSEGGSDQTEASARVAPPIGTAD